MTKLDKTIENHNRIVSYCEEKVKWIRKDCNTAFKTIKSEADTDAPLSLVWLGDCYYYGYGVKSDYHLAVQCYEKAFVYRKNSENRDIIEYKIQELGLCYERGRGTEKDPKAALECFEISAEAGNIYAMCYCGDLYAICFDDMEKAIEYYTLADKIYAKSSHQNLYMNFCDKMEFIIECYTAIANGECENKMQLLGDYYTGYKIKYKEDHIYHEGYREKYTYREVDGFHNTVDGEKGFVWYQKANSRYRLACCYYEGVGTEKNWAKAVEIFQSYANSMEFELYGANALYHCYSAGGYGVEKNRLKAAKWLVSSLMYK